MLESRQIASGASGADGGFFIAGTAPIYDARRLFGADLAWRLHAATLAAQQEVYALAQTIGAADHFRRVGMLRLAVDADEADHVREHVRDLHADGFPGELVPTERLPAAVRRDGRLGLFTAHDGSPPPRPLAASAGARARGPRRCTRSTRARRCRPRWASGTARPWCAEPRADVCGPGAWWSQPTAP